MKKTVLFVGLFTLLTGVLSIHKFGGGSAYAQDASIMPIPNRPVSRPAPARPRPSIHRPITRPRPTNRPYRPRPTRPSPSFSPGHHTRPSLGNHTRPSPGNHTRPSPGTIIRPPVGWTRPTPGSSIPALPVYPKPIRPPAPVIPDPDFGDNRPIVHPPIHRPPHHRPPHYQWGNWYWYNNIGWYHRYRYRNAYIVFVEDLPIGCRNRVRRNSRVYYRCSNVYYRSISLHGERVYEVMIPKNTAVAVKNPSTSNDVTIEVVTDTNSRTLMLIEPYMRGSDVVALQRSLKDRGYNVGSIDGVFGRQTERALKTFQTDVGQPSSGVADRDTMNSL